MLDTPLWKKISLWAVTLALAAAALPSLLSSTGIDLGEDAPEVNLGLDLAGGSHLLLEADPDDVAAERLENMEESVEGALRNATPAIRFGDTSRSNDRLSLLLDSPADIDRARGLLEPMMMGTDGSLRQEWELEVVDTQRLVLTPTESGLNVAVNNAMESAIEVVRRRIDELGTREPTIVRQGSTRIVVQVPGLQDPQALKDLLGKTAQLEFKLVDQQALPSNTEAGIANPGSQIFPYASDSGFAGGFEAVKRLGGIRGDSLTGAQAGVDPQNNRNVVNIQFDQQGGQRFATLSTENVGERFAIILDGEVISAPFFNEPILGGAAQISGNFTPDSANQLSIQLRSGALPVPLTVIEERTVSAELGEQSIRSGMIAMMIGSLAVIALMIATYGRFGIYATGALILNVLILLGLMAIGNFTLTLPGIAGIVLTIGMAVDANVLVFERIREELKTAKGPSRAIDLGYQKALSAIIDANITTFMTATILFALGSGPVKGFAVTLGLGIMTSVFTAIFVTRLLIVFWFERKRPRTIEV